MSRPDSRHLSGVAAPTDIQDPTTSPTPIALIGQTLRWYWTSRLPCRTHRGPPPCLRHRRPTTPVSGPVSLIPPRYRLDVISRNDLALFNGPTDTPRAGHIESCQFISVSEGLASRTFSEYRPLARTPPCLIAGTTERHRRCGHNRGHHDGAIARASPPLFCFPIRR